MAKSKIDKQLAGTEAAQQIPQIKPLFNSVVKKMAKMSVNSAHSLEEYAEHFPIERCISTGLPLLDLNMFHNASMTEWGAACGRWIEIAGIQGIGKTHICHLLTASVHRLQGMVFWIQAEGEFDAECAISIYKNQGVDCDNLSDLNMSVSFARSVEDLFKISKSIIDNVREIKASYESSTKLSFRKNSPPILVVVDSLAALLATVDRNGIEEKGWDSRSRMGGKSKEFHEYFQYVLNEFAELGIAGVGTNHLRANMDQYGPDTLHAHDSALKYYMSLRLSMDKHPKSGSKYYDMLTKAYTKNGRSMIAGYPVRFKNVKKRGVQVEDGIFEIPFYHGYGFDFLYSLCDAAITCGIVRLGAKSVHQFKPTRKEIAEDPSFLEIIEMLPNKDKTVYTNISLLREALASNDDLTVELLTLCYKYGPEPPPDKRGGKAKDDADEEEDEE